MDVHLDGRQIRTEADFHRQLAKALDFGPFYSPRLQSLWERLNTDVERPCRILWHEATVSRQHLGPTFGQIVAVLEDITRQDRECQRKERFEYVLA